MTSNPLCSNSLAANEEGGIYLVTSEAMYKFRFEDGAISQEWRAEYEAGDDALVFTRTKHMANRLAEQLGNDGLTAMAIHGNK